MPKLPTNTEDVLKSIQLNKAEWEALKEVADLYKISRTDAVNRAIAWMLREKVVPGYKKKELS